MGLCYAHDGCRGGTRRRNLSSIPFVLFPLISSNEYSLSHECAGENESPCTQGAHCIEGEADVSSYFMLLQTEVYALGTLGRDKSFPEKFQLKLNLKIKQVFFQTAKASGEGYIKHKEHHVKRQRAVNFSVWRTRSNFDVVKVKELVQRGRSKRTVYRI